MKTTGLLIPVSILLLAFGGCKKSNNNPDEPGKDCRVVAYISEDGSDTTKISYNANGTIASIANKPELKTFEYQAGKIIVTHTSYGNFYRRYIVSVDGTGKITNIRDEKNETGTSWENTAVIYDTDNKNLKQTVTTFAGSGIPVIANFAWSGANVVSRTIANDVVNFTYYLDKPTQAGDYLNYENQIYAYTKYYYPFSSANLVKSIKEDSLGVDVTYTYDNEGKITSFSVYYDGGIQPEIWLVKYECN
jgi:hypothetical protein